MPTPLVLPPLDPSQTYTLSVKTVFAGFTVDTFDVVQQNIHKQWFANLIDVPVAQVSIENIEPVNTRRRRLLGRRLNADHSSISLILKAASLSATKARQSVDIIQLSDGRVGVFVEIPMLFAGKTPASTALLAPETSDKLSAVQVVAIISVAIAVTFIVYAVAHRKPAQATLTLSSRKTSNPVQQNADNVEYISIDPNAQIRL